MGREEREQEETQEEWEGMSRQLKYYYKKNKAHLIEAIDTTKKYKKRKSKKPEMKEYIEEMLENALITKKTKENYESKLKMIENKISEIYPEKYYHEKMRKAPEVIKKIKEEYPETNNHITGNKKANK